MPTFPWANHVLSTCSEQGAKRQSTGPRGWGGGGDYSPEESDGHQHTQLSVRKDKNVDKGVCVNDELWNLSQEKNV